MAVSQSDIDALTTALSNGEKSVRFADGRTVEYHSPADIIKARDYLVRLKSTEDAAASGQRRPRFASLVHAGRGFD